MNKTFTKKIRLILRDIKDFFESTYLCYKYPFLKLHDRRNKFFQSWNYLYCVPEGWRKAFGTQLCEELKQSFLKTNKQMLKTYEILDIKEKFGMLAWYDSSNTHEGHNILKKYENISRYTCVCCGKPARVQTLGWICPYCEDCKPDNQQYVHFGHKGFEYYGWRGNVWGIPTEEFDKEEKLLDERDKWA